MLCDCAICGTKGESQCPPCRGGDHDHCETGWQGEHWPGDRLVHTPVIAGYERAQVTIVPVDHLALADRHRPSGNWKRVEDDVRAMRAETTYLRNVLFDIRDSAHKIMSWLRRPWWSRGKL